MIARTHRAGGTASTAVYSDCARYRYSLTRVWDPAGSRLAFVLLNPSTATETRNDPTVERCERRARQLGHGAFRVVNLFAWRATDPRALRRVADPVGPANDAALGAAGRWADRVLCGWGVHGAHRGRGAAVATLLRGVGYSLCHLGLTRDGHPRHPLYMPYAAVPLPWPAAPSPGTEGSGRDNSAI
ncbi:MAG: DUF1643 domain-containing protein [Rhodobacteraceae bacterium]|nr:DUF1643 domain-containing protein [Paracoccaceae bacterium]MBL4556366.1 DUF1643 domain-containing protein [Paracoccaceae bacterium]HBG98198.1 hypothetical protein [Paracoccaceae bacterium]